MLLRLFSYGFMMPQAGSNSSFKDSLLEGQEHEVFFFYYSEIEGDKDF